VKYSKLKAIYSSWKTKNESSKHGSIWGRNRENGGSYIDLALGLDNNNQGYQGNGPGLTFTYVTFSSGVSLSIVFLSLFYKSLWLSYDVISLQLKPPPLSLRLSKT
jgi:hypothetical protein